MRGPDAAPAEAPAGRPGPPEPRPGLRDVEAYQAPQLEVPVRLNTNECPYALPKGFVEDLAAAVRSIAFHRYPDREATRLRERLAAHVGHPVQGVWAANGSNEVIEQLVLAYGGPGRRTVLFEPTYVLHRNLAWLAHGDVTAVTLDPPFRIEPRHVDEALALEPAVVFVCSPNNPTGNAQPLEAVERLAADPDVLVIVDQAYVEFGGASAQPLVAEHPNVVVVRTFSKAFALAGARIGYCLADPRVVEDLQRVRLPYHLSALTQAAGLTALDHAAEAMAILDAVRGQRDRLLDGLPTIEGVERFPSDANFVLFRPPRPAVEVWNALLERGVLVRDLSKVVEGCLRVTAGTPEETGRFLDALEEILA
jgi:histidinol-phosphate aminotransferase